METKDKSRDQVRRPRPEGSEQTRASRPEARQERPKAAAPAGKPPRRREPNQEAETPRRREPTQKAEAPRRREAEQEGAAPRRKPAEARSPEAAHRKRAAEGENRQKAAARPPQGAPKKKPLRPARESDDTLSSKRRAYGNSKPKKKTAAAAMGDVFKQTANRTAEKAKERRESKKKKHPQLPTPAVIYTQPETFNRNRFLVQMLTVVAVVLALTLGLSVFFKVENITVSGAEVYSAWAVREASGIKEGDNLLSFGNARAGAQIMANLPYVKTVRLGIKLPDTVNIMIEEEKVVYAIKDANGIWWLMTSDGRVVEMATGGKASNYTQILGVSLDNPMPGEQAIAVENVPTETDENGELIPVAVTGSHRLSAALQILEALEENDIVGDAASVDVSRIEDISLWYGSRYQVKLGDASQLAQKIMYMNDVILQMSDYQSGILDISFTIWPDKVGYTPFS